MRDPPGWLFLCSDCKDKAFLWKSKDLECSILDQYSPHDKLLGGRCRGKGGILSPREHHQILLSTVFLTAWAALCPDTWLVVFVSTEPLCLVFVPYREIQQLISGCVT